MKVVPLAGLLLFSMAFLVGVVWMRDQNERATMGIDESGAVATHPNSASAQKKTIDHQAAELRSKVQGARKGVLKGLAYKAYFEYLGQTAIETLVSDADLGIALQAAWEVHTGELRRGEQTKDEQPFSVGADRFIKVFRERLGVTPPPLWEKAFRNARVVPGEWTSFPDPRKGQVRLIYIKQGAAKLGDGLRFQTHARRPGVTFEVVLTSTRTGQELWRSEAWASNRFLVRNPGHHWVDVIVSGNVIIVFGAFWGGVYIEGFHVSDGHATFRFTSNYWMNPSAQWKVGP